MKTLRVEFAPPRQLPRWVWAGLTLVLGGLAVHQGWEGWKLRQRLSQAEGEVISLAAQADHATQAQQQTRGAVQPEPAYARDAKAIAAMAAFPLGHVLATLESTQVQGIKVVSLEVSAADATARAQLEFADHDALMRYLEQINAGEPKPRWALLQSQVDSTTGGVASIGSKWSERQQ